MPTSGDLGYVLLCHLAPLSLGHLLELVHLVVREFHTCIIKCDHYERYVSAVCETIPGHLEVRVVAIVVLRNREEEGMCVQCIEVAQSSVRGVESFHVGIVHALKLMSDLLQLLVAVSSFVGRSHLQDLVNTLGWVSFSAISKVELVQVQILGVLGVCCSTATVSVSNLRVGSVFGLSLIHI